MIFQEYINKILPQLEKLYKKKEKAFYYYQDGDDTEAAHVIEDALMEDALTLIQELSSDPFIKSICEIALSCRKEELERWYA